MPESVSISITTNNISTTNAIKMAIYKDSNPTAIVQSITEAAGAHLARTWNFAGLERVMHFYKLLEIDGSGNTISTIIGPIYFLPSDETIEWKDAVLIQAGVSDIPGNPGTTWPTGINNLFVPDFIGWGIEMAERVGLGSLKYDINQPVDLMYDSTTGYLQLQQTGDVWQPEEWFIFRFKPKIMNSGGVGISNANGFSDILVITDNYTLDENDIGKKILIDPSGNYLEVILPNLPLVIDLKLMYFEMVPSATAKCAKILVVGESGQKIQWLEGNLDALWMCPSENIEFYKRTKESVGEWRINNADGNFKTVGEIIYDDMIYNQVINKALLDGANLDVFQYARLYNRYVLRLTANVVTYAGWSPTFDSKYKFSLKDTVSSNFRIPDSRNVYDRGSSGANIPGAYQRMMIERHKHVDPYAESFGSPFGDTDLISHTKAGSNSTDHDNQWFYTNDGSEIPLAQIPLNATGVIGEETRPQTRITYKFIRI